MTVRVLVVDDDAAIRRVVATGLHARGYEVVEATSAADGLGAVATTSPDLVVLDLGLPDGDGVDVCRRLREFSTVPVVVLSVETTDSRKIEALDAGADDFVTKPFSMGELLARLRAAQRRVPVAPEDPVIRVGPITLDRAARTVAVRGVPVELTDTEYRILLALAQQPGRVLTHAMLLDRVWGPGYVAEVHYLRVYVSRLRHKIERDPTAPRLLVTVPRAGYRLEVPEAASDLVR